MIPITIQGHIDDQHRLVVAVPPTVPPGPVTVSIIASLEYDAGHQWCAGINNQWADELSDLRQDIYSLSDGEAIDPS